MIEGGRLVEREREREDVLLVHCLGCHWICYWDNIRVVVSRRKHNWRPNSWRHMMTRSSHRMPYRCSIHAQAGHMWWRWDWNPVLSRWRWWSNGCRYCASWIWLLASDGRWLVRRSIATIDAGDVMDAWSPSISVDGVQSNEVFLGMAGHLCWSPWYHKVSWNAPPIPFPKLFQTKQKQPEKLQNKQSPRFTIHKKIFYDKSF